MPAQQMHAAVYDRFGGPEVVQVRRVPKPHPGPGEVLIKVHSSTVSAADHRARARSVPPGLTLPAALSLGFFRPRRRILGMDVAGVVEAVGTGVASFIAGDKVIAMLGSRFGGHAQYVVVPEGGAIARMPDNLTFGDAAAIVFGGITAHAFLARAAVLPGTTVLVNGASGAVGTAAVQLASQMGARVTGVCSGINRDLVASLGAEDVVDYTAVDFAAERKYDVIMDCVGNAPFERVQVSLNPGGSLLLVVADLRAILSAHSQSKRSGKLVTASAVEYTDTAVALLSELAVSRRLRAVVDKTFDLADVVAAHRFVDTGRKRGSVVLAIGAP